MNASEGDRRRRRRHSAEFKARVVAACRKSGVSIAAVALDHRLNANLLRRWVVEAERRGGAAESDARVEVAAPMTPMPGFVPMPLAALPVAGRAIEVELRRGSTVVKVSWPLSAAADCGNWLRELLR